MVISTPNLGLLKIDASNPAINPITQISDNLTKVDTRLKKVTTRKRLESNFLINSTATQTLLSVPIVAATIIKVDIKLRLFVSSAAGSVSQENFFLNASPVASAISNYRYTTEDSGIPANASLTDSSSLGIISQIPGIIRPLTAGKITIIDFRAICNLNTGTTALRLQTKKSAAGNPDFTIGVGTLLTVRFFNFANM